MDAPDIINLAVGQPDFKPPDIMVRTLKDNIENNVGYTHSQGLSELRISIKDKLKTENNVKAEKVVVTQGAVEAIFDSMLAHLRSDSNVILFSPYYGKYETVPNLIGSRIKKIPLENNRPDIRNLESKITKKTKMIILNSPSNPTGLVYTKDEIQRITEIVDDHNLILLSDEVYETYVYEKKEHISPGMYSDRVITVMSFSKTYGFPGLRLGFLAGAAELVDPVLDVHLSNTTCSSFASQKAAVAALKQDSFDLGPFKKRRKYMMQVLDDFGVEYIYPEGAFYFYVSVKDDAMKLANKLVEKKLLIMPSCIFGDTNNAIRISYAKDLKTLEKGLDILMRNIE